MRKPCLSTLSESMHCLRRRGSLALVALVTLPSLVLAANVEVVAVTPGQSAAVVIDGAAPITMAVGETIDMVTLVSADIDGAQVRIDGVTRNLPLAVHQGWEASAPPVDSVKLSADARGHFVANGAVNGRRIRFLVDTGASLLTLSRAEANRIGLRYRGGAKMRLSTANGVVEGLRVRLDSVRLGKVTVKDVDAVVIDTYLPEALLGMSFLDRFNLDQRGSTLVLRRRR